MHARQSPVEHRFSFPFYFYAIDLDELPKLDQQVKGFGYNHWKPVNIQDSDYLKGSGGFREKLSEHVDTSNIERIILITVARFISKVFNPVSFYYCLDAENQPIFMVSEVNNTFKERHLYVMPVSGGYPVESEISKQFHVSPFNNMHGRYEFTFSDPSEKLRIGIRLIRNGETIMDAAMWGKGREFTTSNLWKTVLSHPFTAGMTMPRILWQAGILYFKKKMKIYRKPVATSPNTILKTGETG